MLCVLYSIKYMTTYCQYITQYKIHKSQINDMTNITKTKIQKL